MLPIGELKGIIKDLRRENNLAHRQAAVDNEDLAGDVAAAGAGGKTYGLGVAALELT